jgi:hypothetical protein
VLPEESKPGLHGLRISILDLYQSAKSDSFKVLLALLVHKVASGYSPAFDDARERHRSGHGEVEVVSGTDSEVCEELDVADTVGSQLKIANGKTVLCLPPEWP